jgi:hypothetical protein
MGTQGCDEAEATIATTGVSTGVTPDKGHSAISNRREVIDHHPYGSCV